MSGQLLCTAPPPPLPLVQRPGQVALFFPLNPSPLWAFNPPVGKRSLRKGEGGLHFTRIPTMHTAGRFVFKKCHFAHFVAR